MDKLIQDYITRISEDDIKSFATSNGVSLENKDVSLIYYHIKNNWRTILYGNPRVVLDDLKAKLKPEQYQRIENLYIQFKNRYSNFLRH